MSEFFLDSIMFEDELNIQENSEPSFLTGKKDVKQQDAEFTEDFDYKQYVKDEMVKLQEQNLDPQIKKKLIQKIRNWMSAQRSWMRKKYQMQNLEEENKKLKDLIIDYQQKII